MDTPEYTTLAAALKGVPDPRQRRGQRYPWDPDHGCLGQGRASWGIGQWVQEHAAELGDRLGWPAPRLPCEATLRRALRELDLGTLEDCLLRIRPVTEAPKPGRWQGQALDGKGLRGARAHDRPIHLRGLMSHQGGVLPPCWLDAAGHGHHAGCRADPVLPGGADSGAREPLSDAQGQSTDPASAEWQHVPVSGLASGAASVAAPGGADGGQGARPAGDSDPESLRPAGEAAELARSAPGAAPDLLAGRPADGEAGGGGGLRGDQPPTGSHAWGRTGAALAGPRGDRESGALRAGCNPGRRWGPRPSAGIRPKP